MPTEIRGPIDLKVDAFALARRPKLAAHIGIVSCQWIEIEEELISIFIAAMQTEPAIAAAIFGNIFSAAMRAQITQTALRCRFPAAVVRPFEKLAERVKKRAGCRAHIIHGLWTVHADHPNALLRVSGRIDPRLRIERWELRDFAEVETHQNALQLDLRLFLQSLAPFLGATEPGQPERFWRATAPPRAKAGSARRRRRAGSP